MQKWLTVLVIAILGAHAGITAFAQDPYQTSIERNYVESLNGAHQARARGDLAAAKRQLHELLEHKPDYYLANYNLGLVYLDLKLPELAVEYLEKAAAIRTRQGINDYTIYNTLGWVYMSLKRYTDAERSYLRSIDYEASNSEELNRKTYQNLGALYYILQDTQSARKYLNVAIERYHSETARGTLDLVDELEQKQRLIQVNEHLQVSIREGEYIGNKIWVNEGNGEETSLTAWNKQEGHASLGIGHFIWYPKAKEGPFEESFPKLLNLLRRKGVSLPDWLENDADCPWNSYEEFHRNFNSQKMKELRALMKSTFPEQVEFMTERFRLALPRIMDTLEDEKDKKHVQTQFNRVARAADDSVSVKGIYALLDYVHFKGEGVNPNERFNGEGWGLMQVLLAMTGDPNQDPRDEFADAAYQTLVRRAGNNPADRRWLKGWQRRLDTYRETPRS